MSTPHFILTIRCQDAVGIVAAVASALAAADAFITESSHYGDEETGLFFMRTMFRPTGTRFVTRDDFLTALAPVRQRFGMDLNLHRRDQRMKILVAVSKPGHCLNHLLHQWQSGELPVDIVGVVSNHRDHQRLTEWYGIPFHFLPMGTDKAEQEAALFAVFEQTEAELLVLARYMQVLSDDLCQKLAGRAINIHHSFLPSFKGAKPYHQAHARGVKVVGATAHYVTKDLDEGPIIEQETERVAHNQSAQTLARIGKDIESVVLTRAVRWHAEHRVMLNGLRTVVFY